MKANKIKVPISLEIFLLSVVPLLVVAVVSSVLFYNTTTKSIEQTASQLAITATEKLNEEIGKTLAPFQEKVQALNALATYNHDPQFLSIVVQAMGAELSEGFSIYYATEISRFEEGGIFENSNGWVPDPDWEPRTRPWYKAALGRPEEICFTEPYVDSRTGGTCVTISHSVSDGTGRVVGVTAADLALDAVADLVSNYEISDTGTMYLLDEKGMYVTHGDSSKVMSANFFDENRALQGRRQEMLNGKSHAVLHGGQYFAVAAVAGTPWFVAAEGDVSDFTSSVLSTVWIMLMVMGVQVVVVLIIALFFSRLISRTFASMVDHCNKFSKGDFTAHFDSYFIQEADSLARGFEAFSQNIRMLVGKIFRSASSVSEMSTSLANTATSINSSVNDTVEAISSMANTSSGQTLAVQQVDEAVHVIVDETGRLNQEIDAQNSIISTSSTSIEEIVRGMNNVQSRIAATANDMEELVILASSNKSALTTAAQEIVSVRQESASLQEMNSVISSVAAQTNLLAMNAAIEAAHAGAAGKGFAVVADEIRKLAETASKQASSSSSYLKSIQGKIDGIAETAVSIDKSFETTIQRIRDISQIVIQLEQTTSEQGSRSAQVLRALDDIRTSTNNITLNVEAITTSTARTSQLCRNLRDMNNDVNAGIASCKTASVSMKESSDLVNSVASATRQSVSELLDAVGSFQVERRAPRGPGQEYKGPDRRRQSVSLTPPKLS